MTKIYIVRHCEAEGNLYRRCHGQYDGLLTDNGHAQRKCLERYFEGVDISRVFSSDLTRAYATARAIARPKGLEAERCAELREIRLGLWEDMPWGEVQSKHAAEYEKFSHQPHLFSLQGAETAAQVVGRLYNAVSALAKENDGKTIALVSHGLALRILFAKLLGYPADRAAEVSHFDNGSVSLVEWGDKTEVIFKGYNEHLGALSTFAKQNWWRADNKTTDINMCFVPANFPEDAQAVSDMQTAAWKTVHGDLTKFSAAVTLDTAMRMSALDPMNVLFAVNNGKRAGLLTLNAAQTDDVTSGHISLVYLNEDMRGKGLGGQLLGQAISHYRRLGKTSVRLKVSASNKNARRFYEKYGFKPGYEEDSPTGTLIILRKCIVWDRDEDYE